MMELHLTHMTLELPLLQAVEISVRIWEEVGGGMSPVTMQI